MQNFPVTYADTGMAALMTLVAIMTATEMYLTLTVNGHFIDGKEPKSGT